MGGGMKRIKLLIVLIPLFALSGCYTQLALKSPESRDLRGDRYAYRDYDDTLAVDEDSSRYLDYRYYYDDFRNYRRFYFGYYPSSRFYFSIGSFYDPFWYDWYCCDFRYYSPWYYSWYPYYYYGYYYGGYGWSNPWYWRNPYYWNYSPGYIIPSYESRYKYTGLRDTGDRGNYRESSSRDRSGSRSSSYTTRDGSVRRDDVDLNRSSVSRSRERMPVNPRTYKEAQTSTNNSSPTVREETSRRQQPDVRSERATPAPTRERSNDRSNSTNSGRSSYDRPSYNPPSSNSNPSYSPPSRSSSESTSRSSSGSSSGSSTRSSGSDRGR